MGRVRAPSTWPDLDEIHGAFSDAYSLISVVLQILHDDENRAAECLVLGLDVEAFDRAYNRLDEAIVRLSTIRGAS